VHFSKCSSPLAVEQAQLRRRGSSIRGSHAVDCFLSPLLLPVRHSSALASHRGRMVRAAQGEHSASECHRDPSAQTRTRVVARCNAVPVRCSDVAGVCLIATRVYLGSSRFLSRFTHAKPCDQSGTARALSAAVPSLSEPCALQTAPAAPVSSQLKSRSFGHVLITRSGSMLARSAFSAAKRIRSSSCAW
jgi:hypothetical protein